MRSPRDASARVLLIGLALYWVLSFGAVLHHQRDPYWQQGQTIRVMLQNAYISRLWPLARWLESELPVLLTIFSRASVIGQTVFQVGGVWLIRWRWGAWFVGVWGLLFFLASIGLKLSYLPWLELVLWTLIFVRPRHVRKHLRRGGQDPDLPPAVGSTDATGAPRVLGFATLLVGAAIVLALAVHPAVQRGLRNFTSIDIAAMMGPSVGAGAVRRSTHGPQPTQRLQRQRPPYG